MLKTRNTLKFIIFFRTNFVFSHVFGTQTLLLFHPERTLKTRNTLKLLFSTFSFFRMLSESPIILSEFYIRFELSTLTGSIYSSLKLHRIPSSKPVIVK